MTNATSRTASASIPVALAMIAARLEGASGLLRGESQQNPVDRLRLANLATSVDDECTHLRAVAERAVETLGKKPVTVTYTRITGRPDNPARKEYTVAVRDIGEVRPIPEGGPVYDDGYRSMLILRGKDGDAHLALEDHDTIVARIEGHGLAAENKALRAALREMVSNPSTSARFKARQLLGDV